jgi:CubicO group peptidase (beta-lactamase class C family)
MIVTQSYEPVVDLVAARRARAHLCVLSGGEVVLDRTFGCEPDTPFLLFSAGKPLFAVLVHRLAERGVIDLDAPVARYWPEFAARGKHGVTVRQVLQHRSGLPYARSVPGDALLSPYWSRSVRALESARLHHRPGSVPAYHVISYGFLLGELVQRVTGSPLRDALRQEVLDPVGMKHTHLGTPPELWPGRVPLDGGGAVRRWLFNQRLLREAIIPAATVSSTAADLARFYQALLDGRLLGGDALNAAVAPSADGETDRVLGKRVRWSQGFQLGGGGTDPRPPRSLGKSSSPLAFGHNGSNACMGWVDPGRRVVVAYLTNRLEDNMGGSPHQCAVSDTVLACFDNN